MQQRTRIRNPERNSKRAVLTTRTVQRHNNFRRAERLAKATHVKSHNDNTANTSNITPNTITVITVHDETKSQTQPQSVKSESAQSITTQTVTAHTVNASTQQTPQSTTVQSTVVQSTTEQPSTVESSAVQSHSIQPSTVQSVINAGIAQHNAAIRVHNYNAQAQLFYNVVRGVMAHNKAHNETHDEVHNKAHKKSHAPQPTLQAVSTKPSQNTSRDTSQGTSHDALPPQANATTETDHTTTPQSQHTHTRPRTHFFPSTAALFQALDDFDELLGYTLYAYAGSNYTAMSNTETITLLTTLHNDITTITDGGINARYYMLVHEATTLLSKLPLGIDCGALPLRYQAILHCACSCVTLPDHGTPITRLVELARNTATPPSRVAYNISERTAMTCTDDTLHLFEYDDYNETNPYDRLPSATPRYIHTTYTITDHPSTAQRTYTPLASFGYAAHQGSLATFTHCCDQIIEQLCDGPYETEVIAYRLHQPTGSVGCYTYLIDYRKREHTVSTIAIELEAVVSHTHGTIAGINAQIHALQQRNIAVAA